DDLIGSRMTTNFVTVLTSLSIKEAMRSVVDQAAENDNISTIYVVDEEGVYKGAFSLRDLVIARTTSAIEKITITAYPFFYDDEEISQCIEELRDYSEDSIPILSRENKILGVITSNELVDVVDEELGDDYAKLAGLTREEELEEPVYKSVAKRLPWLALLMVLGLVVSSLIGTFEYVVTALPLLVTFQSLILDMSGNGGTQSLAVTIRVITATTLDKKERWRLIFKEIRVGLLNGLIIGVLALVLCTLYITFLRGRSFGESTAIGACIGFSLLSAMTFSAFGGTIIPLIFKRINIDPAVASGPMITTINDLIAATIYYTLSNVLLINVLGIVG
ncbi:MAG: magnesium transporter, partial [Clostridia bacterium]|nr:magnesium transporter [Clostridia bacterium]